MGERPTHGRHAIGLAGLAGSAALLLFGCGKAGAPVPPEPRGPYPPTQVVARQIGGAASVCFTVPDPRGAKPNQTLFRADVLRVTYGPGLQVPRDPQAFRVRSEEVASVSQETLLPGARVCVDDPGLSRLEGGPDGWTLRYAVRVRDRRGRPSSLIAAPDLVATLPLEAPRIELAEMTGDGVLVKWTPPPGREEARYFLYRAKRDEPFPEAPLNVSPLDRSEYLDESAEPGETYRYSVRVQAVSGLPYREGESSDPVIVEATDRFAPSRPTGLVGVQERLSVRLFWNPNEERDLAGYRIERRAPGGDWQTLTESVEPLFLDEAVSSGDRWEYRIIALDRAIPPNESEPSEWISVEVVQDPDSEGRQ